MIMETADDPSVELFMNWMKTRKKAVELSENLSQTALDELKETDDSGGGGSCTVPGASKHKGGGPVMNPRDLPLMNPYHFKIELLKFIDKDGEELAGVDKSIRCSIEAATMTKTESAKLALIKENIMPKFEDHEKTQGPVTFIQELQLRRLVRRSGPDKPYKAFCGLSVAIARVADNRAHIDCKSTEQLKKSYGDVGLARGSREDVDKTVGDEETGKWSHSGTVPQILGKGGTEGETCLVRLMGGKARVPSTSKKRGAHRKSLPKTEMRCLLMFSRQITALLPGAQVLPKKIVLTGVEADSHVLAVRFTSMVEEGWRKEIPVCETGSGLVPATGDGLDAIPGTTGDPDPTLPGNISEPNVLNG